MYTPAQAQSIEHLDGPLLISAGAGSGKTFTLSQRIAHAFQEGTGFEGAPFLDDINSVLAITFTDKAANEIKARVRATLRSIGRVDQALKVDGAWISTIHGMCARILREHALEIGIDPGFSVVSESREEELRNLCIEEVLEGHDVKEAEAYNKLFAEYGVHTSRNGSSVQTMLKGVFTAAAGLESGLDAFTFGPQTASPDTLAREALDVIDQVEVRAEAFCAVKGGKTVQSALDAARACRATLTMLIESAGYEGLTYDGLAQAFGQFSTIKSFGTDEDKALLEDARSTIVRIAGDIDGARARNHAETLMRLARKVESLYMRRLRKEGMLDHDGILRTTLAAFRRHPQIASAYADAFKLVMVDEFQDTNQLQIEMITLLAGKDSRKLCTVGDSQQSLYGFRGADLQVYEQHKEYMRSDSVNALEVRLDANFRSHGDILMFVERIFSQQRAFGDGFLALTEGRDPQRLKTPYHGSAPRLDMVLVTGEKGAKSGELVRSGAEAIAERFSALRAEGHEPRDMVVLLGRMTNAAVYAAALREEGFDCAITGGSEFAQTLEARLVGKLLFALLNPADTQALYAVLESPLFALSADELLALSTVQDVEGVLSSCGIDVGLDALARKETTKEGSRLALAARALSRAESVLGMKRPSRIVTQILAESGMFFRLESCGVDGMAQAADLLKAVRLVASLEEGGKGLAEVARSYEAALGGMKEPPGILTPSEKNFVQIMTIHASKGLEFPLVALADFDTNARARGNALVTEQICGTVYASLAPSTDSRVRLPGTTWKYVRSESEEADSEDDRIAQGPFRYREALLQQGKGRELAEQRRKFYVGATRASEACILILTERQNANREIHADISEAFFADDAFPADESLVEYGARGRMRFTRLVVKAEGDAPEEEFVEGVEAVAGRNAACTFFAVPDIPEMAAPDEIVYRALRKGVFSYSSIAEDVGATGAAPVGLIEGESEEDDDAAWASIRANLASDADKATDLGTAFHRVAQVAACERQDAEELACPSQSRIDAIAGSCRLSADQAFRLRQALMRWFASDVAKQAAAFTHVRAEVPFLVGIEQEGKTHYLEGEIDLLCTDASLHLPSQPEKRKSAFVVDYKTGGHAEESADAVFRKHYLQAACYAYALVVVGYDSVDLAFVRVEQPDVEDPDQPQVVRYAFTAAQYDELAEHIRRAYQAAQ